MKLGTGILLTALLLGLASLAAAQTSPDSWEILSTETIGARQFIQAHPEWDGRGVLIAVCDTGVALNLPGLIETSDGKQKVIDARVFSSQGFVDLERATEGSDEKGAAWYSAGNGWLYGIEALPVKPADDAVVKIGYFDEGDFKNSSLSDINQNGRKDDVFGIVAFETADGRTVAFIDTDADGSLEGEEELGDFSETRKSFRLGGGDEHASADMAWFALNLWFDDDEAALCVDDGAHGTHVAGIAAGHNIDGQEGYDGIAPGAQVLGLKLGDNTLSGGATTPGSMLDSWHYAVKRARELNMPLVIQMSFGVGSENEGTASAEKLIDEILADNPDVVATVSAGNEGPGLSTVGLPAASRHVMAVGAVLAKSSARDLYSVNLSQDEMFYFSSRGGEVNKPDIVCPGFSASTVPVFSKGRNVFRGTSMAAPQAAGAAALLMSAAQASNLAVRRDWIVSALQRSAKPLPGYGPLDQGPGQVNVPAAWEVYKAIAQAELWEPQKYYAETESPEMAEGSGPAVHWRGDYYPKGGDVQKVSVYPVFPSDAPEDYKVNFYKGFTLACPADWVDLVQETVYMKAKRPAEVTLRFKESRLKKPGLYQTAIEGRSRGNLRLPRQGPDFLIPVSIVVPETAKGPDFLLKRQVKGLKPAKVDRLFFRVEPDVGAVTLEAVLPESSNGRILVDLFDPEGREHILGRLSPEKRRVETRIDPLILEPGVWELDLYAYYDNAGPAEASVRIRAVPMVMPADNEIPLELEAGKAPHADLHLTSGLGETLEGSIHASVTGSIFVHDEELKKSKYKRKFSVLEGESSVEFRFSLSGEDFNLFTDMAVMILNSSGGALVQDGLAYRKGVVEFEPPEGTTSDDVFTLKLIAATADPDVSRPKWTLRIEEIHRYTSPIPVDVTMENGSSKVVLYPDHPAELELDLGSAPPAVATGGYWLLEGEIQDARQRDLRIPLEIKLKPE